MLHISAINAKGQKSYQHEDSYNIDESSHSVRINCENSKYEGAEIFFYSPSQNNRDDAEQRDIKQINIEQDQNTQYIYSNSVLSAQISKTEYLLTSDYETSTTRDMTYSIKHKRENLLKEAFSDWAFEILSASNTACAMIEDACERKWALSISDTIEQGFIVDVENATIMLGFEAVSSTFSVSHEQVWNKTLLLLIKALRDVWQENRYGGFDEIYGVDDVLFLSRIRAADTDIMGILVAWELKEAGYNGLWKYILSSEELDIAEGFLSAMDSAILSEDEKQNGYVCASNTHIRNSALQTSFAIWFQSETRVRDADHGTLNYLDSLVAEHNAQNIAGDVFGSARLHHKDIEHLSCLPDRTAYLKGSGADIQHDPYYSGMDDEYNQAHYLQIMHDFSSVCVEGVAFRSSALADRIFPKKSDK